MARRLLVATVVTVVMLFVAGMAVPVAYLRKTGEMPPPWIEAVVFLVVIWLVAGVFAFLPKPGRHRDDNLF